MKTRTLIKRNDQTYLIPLGRSGQLFAIIDSKHQELVSGHNFYLSKRGYAETTINYKNVKLHHLIAGKPSEGYVTDHINGDPLDNREANLRTITQKLNCYNAVKHKMGSSKYKGVCYDKTRNLWRAYIAPDGKQKQIGRFETAESAAEAYDEVARRTFGEYAVLNFSERSAA